jgi:hypothetical protein
VPNEFGLGFVVVAKPETLTVGRIASELIYGKNNSTILSMNFSTSY